MNLAAPNIDRSRRPIRQLDAAVCDTYGWPHDLPDEAILERLLALNLERAQAYYTGMHRLTSLEQL